MSGFMKKKRKKREILFQRQKGHCAICGDELKLSNSNPLHPNAISIDHIIPRSLGGSNFLHNLRVVHRRCNIARGNDISDVTPDMSPKDYNLIQDCELILSGQQIVAIKH